MPRSSREPETAYPDSGGEPTDPLHEVEAVRALLQEAVLRLSRLLAVLKQQRRHSRAVETALASLRQLRLDR